MSILIAEVYDALLAGGVPEDKARAAASAIPAAKDLATKQDIAELRSELKQDIAELRSELKQDIAILRFAVFTFGPLILALLVKLVFFP